MTPWAAGVCMVRASPLIIGRSLTAPLGPDSRMCVQIPYEICQLFRQCLFLVCSRTADMCNDRWKRIVFCSRLCWLVP